MDLFFIIQKMYPRNMRFKVQKDHFARMLEPIMKREMARRHTWLSIDYIPISTTISKVHRIKGLQSFFKLGLIRFAETITCKSDVIDEILRFPKGAHDDVLDTLADQMQDVSGNAISYLEPREKEPWERAEENGLPVPDIYLTDREPEMANYYADVTGI